MSLETEFYLKMLGVFVASGIFMKIMMIMQKRKEEEAERKFQQTIRMIELRDRKYKPKDKQ
jgi:hypothetical protein